MTQLSYLWLSNQPQLQFIYTAPRYTALNKIWYVEERYFSGICLQRLWKPQYQLDTLQIKQGLSINVYSTTFGTQVLKIVN